MLLYIIAALILAYHARRLYVIWADARSLRKATPPTAATPTTPTQAASTPTPSPTCGLCNGTGSILCTDVPESSWHLYPRCDTTSAAVAS